MFREGLLLLVKTEHLSRLILLQGCRKQIFIGQANQLQSCLDREFSVHLMQIFVRSASVAC